MKLSNKIFLNSIFQAALSYNGFILMAVGLAIILFEVFR